MKSNELWKKGVVYQIYPRSFLDSNNDGIGDLQGIISKLDYIKSLGVDIIWLSPVYQSPNDDNGYDISDYLSIHPDFGTMEDMDMLLDKANTIGLKIIMDLVINHTSDEHPWFIESKKSKDNPYRDYYIWQEKPNNWTSFFSGSAWDQIEDSYYLHLFSKKQPDLNWINPKVFDEIQNIMHFWLKKGIYGFRCDVINIIFKSSLADGKKRMVLTGREFYHSQEGCHDILRRLREKVLDHYDCFTVGETVMVTPKEANDLILPERKELDMVFSFEHMETDQINNKWFKTKFRPNKWMKVINKWQQEAYWNANYLENHDQQRSVSRFGDDKKFHQESSKMLLTILLSLKGTPYIYQGQEIGMTNGDFKDITEYKDVETHRIYGLAKKLHFPNFYINHMLKTASRDHARTPMQWSKNGDFTKGTPWIKMNANTDAINVSENLKTPNSILNYLKELIKLRKTYDVLIDGSFKPFNMKKNVFVYERKNEKTCIIVVANMSRKQRKNPVFGTYKILISNIKDIHSNPSHLKPYQAIIMLKEDNS